MKENKFEYDFLISDIAMALRANEVGVSADGKEFTTEFASLPVNEILIDVKEKLKNYGSRP